MPFSKPITEIIAQRRSCRTYQNRPLEEATRRTLEGFLSSLTVGRLGTPLRLQLLASGPMEPDALRGLGTYGIIRGASAFLVGAVSAGLTDMEEFGYALEHAVLLATDLGLGTCWLGGTFKRNAFSARVGLRPGESMPAVAAVGYATAHPNVIDALMRRGAGSARRQDWERLFFAERFGVPLARERAGTYAVPLDMLRQAPSASNKQPWRVVHDGAAWHFYVQRTPGHAQLGRGVVALADMQRVDLGIGMCHFELTARELGLRGDWARQDPALSVSDALTEYIITWVGAA